MSARPEPPAPLWLVLLVFPLSLGIVAAGVLFLYHALLADNPPGTTVVNPAFSVLMLVAGGVGLHQGCAAILRRTVGQARTLAPSPPAPLPERERGARPASEDASPTGGPEKTLDRGLWLLGWLSALKMWLVPLFLVGFGLYLLIQQEMAVWQWHPTEGEVLESRVESRYLRTNPPRPPLVPRIRYRYEVAGSAFQSTQVTTGEPLVFATTDEAEQFLVRHLVGGKVAVLYLPDAPRQATLMVSRDSGWWIPLGFGLPCLLLVAFLSWKRRLV
jgi:hypothetical protein